MKVVKRELKLAIVGNVIGIIVLVAFFTILELLTPISIASVIVSYTPAMIAGVFGGLVGSYISLRRRPDERMQQILKHSARNAFWALIMSLPFMGVAFMFLPTQTGMFYGIWLFGLWIIAMVIFYLSAIYYYYS